MNTSTDEAQGHGAAMPLHRALPVLLLSVVLMVLGNGLQGTLLSLRAGVEQMADESVGLMMSAYFLGFMLGSIFIPYWIQTVGHIRTFAAFASIASAIALLHILFVAPWPWTLMRIVRGFCYAGLILVVESWLNGASESSYRGRVLATYQITMMLAWTVSQLLLNVASPKGYVLFLLISIAMSLSLVPVTLGRLDSPGLVTARRLGLGGLFAISPLGVVGVFVFGLQSGAFLGMGPLFAHQIGLGAAGVAWFMALTMAGAVLLQWPLGWISDQVDRRLVILTVALAAAVISALLAGGGALARWMLLSLAFGFGALVLPLYSICVAHVYDRIERESVVAAASGLILVYGAGSALGPFGAGLVMGRVGPGGLYMFTAVLAALFALFGLYRQARRGAVLQRFKSIFVSLPRTTHLAVQLDKRAKPTAVEKEAPR